MGRKTIEEVLKENNLRLLSIGGVVGTAESLCDGKPCIQVYVRRISPDIVRRISDTIDGYPVLIEETGEVRTLPQDEG